MGREPGRPTGHATPGIPCHRRGTAPTPAGPPFKITIPTRRPWARSPRRLSPGKALAVTMAFDAPARPALAVLVVDDNRDAADTLAELVGLLGHAARAAYTPAGALEALDSFAPDVVLMDVGIPGMDGYKLAHAVCGRLGRRPLLVAVTGHTTLA